MVVGSSIGAGMLALPIATAELGFIGSLILLFTCWAVMLSGALLLLEVNLWLPQRSHLVSMAKATIGPIGQLIAWLAYLLLLYSLLCAYIAGGSDLLRHLLQTFGMSISPWTAAISFTLLFGWIVYIGVQMVDYVNRGLMLFKFITYFGLIAFLTPFLNPALLAGGALKNITLGTAITVTITSFGFGSIIPSLRIYYAGDVRKLKQTIVIGSLIPLIIYAIWDAIIMGVIPLQGTHGLVAVLNSSDAVSQLVKTLSGVAMSGTVTLFTKVFTSICVLTSFLCVALSLVDFVADGFQLEKQGKANLFIHAIAFLPPLIIVMGFPGIFIDALQYAGIYCAILLLVLPALMAWRGRYYKGVAGRFLVPGGRFLLLLVGMAGLFVIFRGLGRLFCGLFFQ